MDVMALEPKARTDSDIDTLFTPYLEMIQLFKPFASLEFCRALSKGSRVLSNFAKNELVDLSPSSSSLKIVYQGQLLNSQH